MNRTRTQQKTRRSDRPPRVCWTNKTTQSYRGRQVYTPVVGLVFSGA